MTLIYMDDYKTAEEAFQAIRDCFGDSCILTTHKEVIDFCNNKAKIHVRKFEEYAEEEYTCGGEPDIMVDVAMSQKHLLFSEVYERYTGKEYVP
jgi:hypothetical protein